MFLHAPPAPLFSPEDLAAYLGVPIQTVYAWRARGRGPRAMRIGRHLRYSRDDVAAWLAEQAIPRTQDAS